MIISSELILSESASSSLEAADTYPVGIIFDIVFDAFTARLTSLPYDRMRFHIAEGPYAKTETVEMTANWIRPGVFAVSWVEASGATVVHVEDFERSIVHSHATLPDGTFLRMQGPIHLVSKGKDQ